MAIYWNMTFCNTKLFPFKEPSSQSTFLHPEMGTGNTKMHLNPEAKSFKILRALEITFLSNNWLLIFCKV